MRKIRISLFLLGLATLLAGQNPIAAAHETVLTTLGKLNMGTSKTEFLAQKPGLPIPEPTMSFRTEIVETIEKNGLQSTTYYFDLDSQQPLYELILKFSSEEIRTGVIQKMFGQANHPTRPDHWILGEAGGIMTIGWAFGSKFALAANLPGTEWDGNELFKMPAGFQLTKMVPSPTEWSKTDVDRFFTDLQLQVDAGLDGFEKIKGDSVNTFFKCKLPMGIAEMTGVMDDGNGRLAVNNVMVSGMTLENAVNWQSDMSRFLDKTQPDRYRLVRGNFKNLFGKTAAIWNVLDKMDQRTGFQIGLVVFGEGLPNVYLVVMHE